MDTVNIHEAKTHFSRLVLRAAAGEEIIIARAGQPLARLVPLAPPKPKRQFGLADGQIRIPDDFKELPADIQAFFDDPDIFP